MDVIVKREQNNEIIFPAIFKTGKTIVVF